MDVDIVIKFSLEIKDLFAISSINSHFSRNLRTRLCHRTHQIRLSSDLIILRYFKGSVYLYKLKYSTIFQVDSTLIFGCLSQVLI